MFAKTQTAPKQYVDIPFECYDHTTLQQAAAALGEDVLKDQYVEMYELAIKRQNQGKQVTTAQLRGMTATHVKIKKFLQTQPTKRPKDPARNPEATLEELAAHIRNLENALLFLKSVERGEA